MTLRRFLSDYRVAIDTAIIVASIVAVRAILVAAGVDGMTLSPLTSSIVAGGVFVMGLVVAGTLSDYKDADRAPADMATELYAVLRECESMDATWGKPDMARLRERLIAVVTALRSDIDAGNTRECQQAVEDLSESFLELENSDVPANYIVRLRQSQSALRKAVLRVYHIQREEFLPSAYAMIVSLVVIILAVVLFTDFEGTAQSLVTVGFLSFFFVYLLRLLRVIDKPFKVGRERTDDDVSLFLLTEFVVHAHAADEGVAAGEVEAQAEEVEELLSDVEEQEGEVIDVADLADQPSSAAQD
jgi:ABC-type multidrug transport system fused ATPase/permease subunit